ncbi:MAG: GNAT family N-acetyltransferase [Chitinophagaceae bacterium]|nr:GNAT family N-acetyltransferase [Chitinophagaceae bacterium]
MINLLTEDIVLEDKRAQLIALNNTHLPAFINYAITEPDTWRYSLVSPGSSKTAMENYVAYALKERLENKGYPFAIIDKQTHEIAGCSRFYDIDFTHKIATIGYTCTAKNLDVRDLTDIVNY